MAHHDTWQLFYKNGEPIKGGGWDSALDNPKPEDNAIVGAVGILLFRINDGVLELLWQHRSKTVTTNADLWDFSANGHINLGETCIEAAVRETYEEIGVEISADDLNYVGGRPLGTVFFRWLFLVDWTNRPDNFRFDDGEVSEVRWVPFSKQKEFREQFAKPRIRKDEPTFQLIEEWFKEYHLI